MNTQDAKTVIGIMLCADGGCPFCVTSLLQDFIRAYPVYTDITKSMFHEAFDSDLEVK